MCTPPQTTKSQNHTHPIDAVPVASFRPNPSRTPIARDSPSSHDYPRPERQREREGRSAPDPPARMAASILPAVLLTVLLLTGAEAVWLDLPPSGTKCVSEEIQPNVVVLADYALMYESHPTAHPTVAVKVRAPARSPLPVLSVWRSLACGFCPLFSCFILIWSGELVRAGVSL